MSPHGIRLQRVFVVISVWYVASVFADDSDNFQNLLQLRGKIAQCRASCIETFVVGHPIKFNYDGSAMDVGCTTKANWKCNMCWDYCEALAIYERTRAQMCADDICLEGCQHSCKFMQETASTSSTATPEIVSSSARLQLATPKVAKTGVVISWTMSDDKLMYVVFGLTGINGLAVPVWEEIQQTTGRRLMLPMDAKYEEIVVAAFNSKEMVAKTGKKMVFQLRTKRAIEQFEEVRVGKIEFNVATYFTSFLCLFALILVAIFAAIVKIMHNIFTKKDEEPIIWV